MSAFGGDGPTVATALIGVTLLAIMFSGLIQVGLGAAGLGGLVKVVPHPVLAGIINGFALQIIIMQVPKLFGLATAAEVLR